MPLPWDTILMKIKSKRDIVRYAQFQKNEREIYFMNFFNLKILLITNRRKQKDSKKKLNLYNGIGYAFVSPRQREH